MIRDSLLNSRANLSLVTGLDFCQTEPGVLRDWISKAFLQKGARPYLYIGPETFHPKVFVVKAPTKSFAIVGSGNLSAGGLRDNVECFMYVSSPKAVATLTTWIEDMTQDRSRCVRLTAEDITEYEPRWKRAARSRNDLHQRAKQATHSIATVREVHMEHWRQAVAEARRYFRSPDFNYHDEQRRAARNILRLLHHPDYTFTRNEWSGFYDIWNMGHLIPFHKFRVYKQKNKLRAALRLLSQSGRPITERVDAILDSRRPTRVSGLGINAVSKILASIEPKKWPVWNNPVKRALDDFGYRPPRGATPGQKYAAFAELMMQFMKETNAPDTLALDCFFFGKGRATED